MKNPYFIFDRDGTLIDHVPHLSKVAEVRLKRGVLETLPILQKRGFRFGIVTNQSVIARKIASVDLVEEINTKIVDTISQSSGVKFDFIRVCPHLPEDECNCRKPKPGLLYDVIPKFEIACEKSYMVGDSESDVLFGKNLGFKTILINENPTYKCCTVADRVIINFSDILKGLESANDS